MVNSNGQQIGTHWERLIKLAETINFGHVDICFQNGQPVKAEIIVKQVRLDNEEDFNKNLKIISL